MNSIHNEEVTVHQGDELWRIYFFLKKNSKKILLFTGIGIVLALLFAALIPRQYEAITHVQMARFNPNNKEASLALNNIETPSLLMARLRLPSSYTQEVTEICGVPAPQLIETIQTKLVRDTTDTIELKVRRETVAKAEQCSQAIFTMIKQYQEKLLQPFLMTTKKKLSFYQQELAQDKLLLNKLENQHNASAFNFIKYLKINDQIKFDMEQIDTLEEQLAFGNKATTLVTPIYTSTEAIYPKQVPTLLIGAFLGLLAGIAFALSRRISAQNKLRH